MFQDAESIAQDSVWIYESRHGNPDSFRNIVLKYQDYIYDLCYRLTGNHQDAEDFAQETFVAFYGTMDRFNPTLKLSNWLYTIALNFCRKHLRRKKIVQFLSLNFKSPFSGEEMQMDPPDQAPNAEAVLQKKEETVLTEKMVMSLPDALRTAFVMRFYKEMSHEDIAEVLAISVANVKVKIHRAKQYLMDHYGTRLVSGVTRTVLKDIED